MGRRLPSLNALKAFEAAARLESFTDAAAELFVTHAAISRHIRDLEEWLGTQLFIRTGRGVDLTDAGQRYRLPAHAPVRPDWPMQRARPRPWATCASSRSPSNPPLPRAGWCRGSAASTIFIPISNWPSTRPTSWRISASGEADVGIRYGAGSWDDVEAMKLTDAVIFPVARPSLLKAQARPQARRSRGLQPAA